MVILCGAAGSGRSTLARAMADARAFTIPPQELDLNVWFNDFGYGLGESAGSMSHFSGGLCWIVRNLENDDGRLLEAVAECESRHGFYKEGCLIGCTSDRSGAQAWKRLFAEVELIDVPALDQRQADIAPLIQRFVREASELCGSRVKCFSAEVVEKLQGMAWPGNVTQLRATVIDAAIRATLFAEDVMQIVQDDVQEWNKQQTLINDSLAPSALSAARMLELSGYNYRLAAARLGIVLPRLFGILGR